MVLELLSRVLNLKQHIVFLLLLVLSSGVAFSQSVLLPADVVIVSVNSSEDSFDFIPLVNLEEGTTIWFSNGIWNEETLSIQKGDEVKITLKAAIEGGTNIHVNQIEDPRVAVEGHLNFSGKGDRILAFQKDEGVARVIYGIGWGSSEVWNPESKIGSGIPSSISKNNNSLIQLGPFQNYQYYLRNGASGTPSMLAAFVGDQAKWKGRNSSAFNSFGTAFRILSPPVVLFDESISTTRENDSIILNVAIYEHDGSRLTVDAVFNQAFSTADTNDIGKFKKQIFNFTGLIGDAVYAVEITVSDDKTYESTENAFFELQNLSKGELGDFVTHVSFITDNEIPNIQISSLNYSGDPDSDFIEIQSNERLDADISGWKLESRGEIYEFPFGSYITPFGAIKVVHPESKIENPKAISWLRRNQGNVELRNEMGQLVSSLNYGVNQSTQDRISNQSTSLSGTRVNSQENVSSNAISGLETIVQESQEVDNKKSGWYILNADLKNRFSSNQKLFFSWDEESASFINYVSDNQEFEQKIVLGYFTEEELAVEIEEQSVDTLNSEPEDIPVYNVDWKISLSATDLDENGVINGPEGYNFVRSELPEEISVQSLISNLEASLFDGAIYPNVFLWEDDGQGWMSARKLSLHDIIPPHAFFWIKADSVFERIEIQIQPEAYNSDPISYEEGDNESESELKISLETETNSQPVSILFFDDIERIRRDVLAPELENRLRVSGEDYLFFGVGSGLNWNTKVYLESILDQRMMFPLAFETSESGNFKLSVQKFDGIPPDWKISLIDEISQKEYELDKNWKLEFDHLILQEEINVERSLEPDTDSEESSESENRHRFMLVITPPEAQGVSDEIPDVVSLHQNYPNPFNPVTTISFYLPESVPVKLSVFNVVGQPVAVLSEGTLGAGDHEFEWDASGLPSGMYIYQLEVGAKVMTRKMTLVK